MPRGSQVELAGGQHVHAVRCAASSFGRRHMQRGIFPCKPRAGQILVVGARGGGRGGRRRRIWLCCRASEGEEVPGDGTSQPRVCALRDCLGLAHLGFLIEANLAEVNFSLVAGHPEAERGHGPAGHVGRTAHGDCGLRGECRAGSKGKSLSAHCKSEKEDAPVHFSSWAFLAHQCQFPNDFLPRREGIHAAGL
jgi:hypothetical protein